MRKMLCLDLSTTCTGWSVWDIESKKLLDYGALKPNKKGMSKLEYPEKQLLIMKDLSKQICQIIDKTTNLSIILIEEVNTHKSRMTGKTLDGIHWILLNEMNDIYRKKVRYIDSDGPIGWRTRLNLRLSENDKKLNAERKKINKKLKSKDQLPIINKKHLAARYVNSVLGLGFDVDQNSTDNDIVDSLGLGLAFLMTIT